MHTYVCPYRVLFPQSLGGGHQVSVDNAERKRIQNQKKVNNTNDVFRFAAIFLVAEHNEHKVLLHY